MRLCSLDCCQGEVDGLPSLHIMHFDGVGGAHRSPPAGSRRMKQKSYSTTSTTLSALARRLSRHFFRKALWRACTSAALRGVGHASVSPRSVPHAWTWEHRPQQIAVLVNRAALNGQAFTPEGHECDLQTRRAVDDHQAGLLQTTGIQVLNELAPHHSVLPFPCCR